MPRKPNTICSQCGKPVYQRPNQLKKYSNAFCNRGCQAAFRSLPVIQCENCGKDFQRTHSRNKFCCRQCAQEGRDRTRNKYKFPGKSAPERRLNELKHNFDFDSCMIQGCEYNKLYEIHRLIPGSRGGEYTVGNMFAICPNHHAEIHRGITSVEKVDDCTLKVIGE